MEGPGDAIRLGRFTTNVRSRSIMPGGLRRPIEPTRIVPVGEVAVQRRLQPVLHDLLDCAQGDVEGTGDRPVGPARSSAVQPGPASA